jgi:hypothetical protein
MEPETSTFRVNPIYHGFGQTECKIRITKREDSSLRKILQAANQCEMGGSRVW